MAESGSPNVNNRSAQGGNSFTDRVANFFGLSELDAETKERYRKRREQCYRTDLKDQGDDVDFGIRLGRRKCGAKKKESFTTVVGKAMTGKKEKHKKVNAEEKIRSFAPGDLEKSAAPNFDEFKEELFYDEVDMSIPPSKPKESQMDMAMARPQFDEEEGDDRTKRDIFINDGFYPHSAESTLWRLLFHFRLDFGPDIPLTRIEKPRKPADVADKPALSRLPAEIASEPKRLKIKKKREPIFDQLLDSVQDFFCCKICRWKNSESSNDKRQYFTYFITFVQVVIMIASVSVYGFAKPHHSKVTEQALVLKPTLSIELVRRAEFGNIWLGPRQADLIHLGAKYSPCMRKDINLEKVFALDRQDERESGCCVRDDGAGCVQTVESHCSKLISTFVKWNKTHPSSKGFTSGAVCGQDPKFCTEPLSKPPFEWKKSDITEWPLCKETRKPPSNGSAIIAQPDRHMSCELLGRPCCHGIQGECMITTREHCDFLKGYYHDEAFLCSQVNCFEEVCGMIPFVHADRPDQFSRVLSANLLHAGFLHMLISFFFQIIVMVRVEKVIGSLKVMFIYFGSGIIGTLASCVLLPYHVETGPAGAHFGILACIYVDIIYNILYNWQNDMSHKNGGLKSNLAIYSAVLLILFLLGLLPWVDNWAHIFGFVSGALLSLVLIKDLKLEEKGLTKLRVIIVSLLLFVLMFVLLMIGFYVVPITEGSWVQYINCIPFDDTFCQNMDVSIKRGSSYTSYW